MRKKRRRIQKSGRGRSRNCPRFLLSSESRKRRFDPLLPSLLLFSSFRVLLRNGSLRSGRRRKRSCFLRGGLCPCSCFFRGLLFLFLFFFSEGPFPASDKGDYFRVSRLNDSESSLDDSKCLLKSLFLF